MSSLFDKLGINEDEFKRRMAAKPYYSLGGQVSSVKPGKSPVVVVSEMYPPRQVPQNGSEHGIGPDATLDKYRDVLKSWVSLGIFGVLAFSSNTITYSGLNRVPACFKPYVYSGQMVGAAQIPISVVRALQENLENNFSGLSGFVFQNYEEEVNIRRLNGFRLVAGVLMELAIQKRDSWVRKPPPILCYRPEVNSFTTHEIHYNDNYIGFSDVLTLLSAVWCNRMLLSNDAEVRDVRQEQNQVLNYPIIDISVIFSDMAASMNPLQFVQASKEFNKELGKISPGKNQDQGIPLWRVPILNPKKNIVGMTTAYLGESGVYISTGPNRGANKYNQDNFFYTLQTFAEQGCIVGNPPFQGLEYPSLALFIKYLRLVDDGIFPPPVIAAENFLRIYPGYSLGELLINPFGQSLRVPRYQ